MHVLLVTHSDAMAARYRKRLEHTSDYDLVVVASPAEALNRIDADALAVVIAAHAPSSFNGVHFLRQVRVQAPTVIRLLLISEEDTTTVDALDDGIVHFLLRTEYSDEELQAVIRRGIEWYVLIQERQREQARLDYAEGASNDAALQAAPMQMPTSPADSKADLAPVLTVLRHLIRLHSARLLKHSVRVAHLVLKIARRLELPPRLVEQVRIGALLHDVGKVLISPSSLRKPQSIITPEERAPLLHHPEWGERMLSALPALEEATRFVRHHHEFYNGGGYPDKLPRCQIPLGARLIAVANAYDNYRQGRNVFRPQTPAQAIEAIHMNTPDKYDPLMVELLTREVQDTWDEESALVGVSTEMLQPGMKLGQDLSLKTDLLLLAEGITLDPDDVERIRQIGEATPTLNWVLVHKSTVPDDAHAPVA